MQFEGAPLRRGPPASGVLAQRYRARMFRHVVLLRFRPDDSGSVDATVRAVTEALAVLPSQIAALRSYEVGTDLGLAADNAHLAVVADFDDEAGYVAYRDHPAHRAVIEDLILPALESRTAAQFRR